MHDSGSHQHWPQCYQCAKEEKSTLEDTRIHANDVVFSGPAHSLLLKTSPVSTDRQTRKSTSVSLLASPQAARKKKKYIKLDLLALAPQDLASSLQNEYDGLGSIGSPAA